MTICARIERTGVCNMLWKLGGTNGYERKFERRLIACREQESARKDHDWTIQNDVRKPVVTAHNSLDQKITVSSG
jgi:hypothetical protein